MSEIRLYITTTEMRAGIALSLMTDAFEEEGYAIATMEIDEKLAGRSGRRSGLPR